MLRSTLAGTRTLILLDNVLDEAQIRPLLPGGDGCLVLVTSRRRLKGLDEAMSLSLGLLPEADSAALFRAVAGPGRVEPGAPSVADIVDLCGYLPLALRIAAAILRHRPSWSVERLAALLRARANRVGALTDGERDLSAIFDLSTKRFPPGRGPCIEGSVCTQESMRAPSRQVHSRSPRPRPPPRCSNSSSTTTCSMSPSPGRYRSHDLIRIHARGLADANDPGDSAAAAHAALDYYLATTRAADRHLARRTLRVDVPPSSVEQSRRALALSR